MKRLLIEDWLPIAEIGAECMREASAAQKPPVNRLHVWWARRPLVASRAAILASLLPAEATHAKFLHALGIHGDPLGAQDRIAKATQDGVILGKEAYGYPRAFKHNPDSADLSWFAGCTTAENAVLLDPTAGGGSVPFEGVRLGLTTVANDLNPVAWLVLKATTDFPQRHGKMLLKRYQQIGRSFASQVRDRIRCLYPAEPPGSESDGYLWARTITCPYCNGVVPLSPNWVLSPDGKGVRLKPDNLTRKCAFEVVLSLKEQSKGTVRDGVAECPYSDCGRVIEGDEVKKQAQAGQMGHQLYAVVYKYDRQVGETKGGKPKYKSERAFRAPCAADDVETLVADKLAERMPEWLARNIIPDEEIGELSNYDRGHKLYGIRYWRDMFSPRQLYGHCTSVEVFGDLVEEARRSGMLTDLDRAAFIYLAFAIDKILNYNCVTVRWIVQRGQLAGQFDTHNFSFKWSYAEMATTMAGVGYDWAIEQTGKALGELIDLLGHQEQASFDSPTPSGCVDIRCGSADAISLEDASVDCIVMDPPYYNNVMYAELSDFFYVWLRRTAGILYPKMFLLPLTDQDREAVANAARFKGQKAAADLAGEDYERRMGAIFAKCRRVLKPGGVMTVMFTHKATGAWDALAGGLVNAGFVITASWPVNTEFLASLHIHEKTAARSTIFLVCRLREEEPASDAITHWEDIEPLVARAVRDRVAVFQGAGIKGVDLYLASFGPALQVFSEHWPLQRGRARPEAAGKQRRLFDKRDPYEVRAEDALEAARREVKNWRMQQLATVRRQQLDALTEWYVLAWDAFSAPRFPSDEALKLARVVGLDFDKQVKDLVCEVKGDDVVLWDSVTRKAHGVLAHVSDDCMLDVLHFAAASARELRTTAAAKDVVERANLLGDPTIMVALQALLNVLPPSAPAGKKSGVSGASTDFAALELLRRLAFAEDIPAPANVPGQLSLELESES